MLHIASTEDVGLVRVLQTTIEFKQVVIIVDGRGFGDYMLTDLW